MLRNTDDNFLPDVRKIHQTICTVIIAIPYTLKTLLVKAFFVLEENKLISGSRHVIFNEKLEFYKSKIIRNKNDYY